MGKLAKLIVQPQDMLYDLLGIFQPKVGEWYDGICASATATPWIDVAANVLHATYYPVFRKFRADRIYLRVSGGGGSGALARLGLYEDDDWYPGSLIQDFGELDVSTSGWKYKDINLTLDAKRYWTACVLNNSLTDLRLSSAVLTAARTPTSNLEARLYISYTYGSLPDPFPTGALWAYKPLIIRFRVAEVF